MKTLTRYVIFEKSKNNFPQFLYTEVDKRKAQLFFDGIGGYALYIQSGYHNPYDWSVIVERANEVWEQLKTKKKYEHKNL